MLLLVIGQLASNIAHDIRNPLGIIRSSITRIEKQSKNIEYFKKVKVDEETETISWENGADFSPEFLYEIGK